MPDSKVLRLERKYYISHGEYMILKSLLGSVLVPDLNGARDGEYYVRSVYFDSLTNENYYDKMVGIKNRQKLRARIYDKEATTVKLEIKEKDGDYLIKDTLTISKEEYQEALNHRYDFLKSRSPKTQNVFMRCLYSTYLRPVITVDYEREAYVHPFSNIRINFDKNIRISQTNFDLFCADMIMTPLSMEPLYVLEIKYNDFLPEWLMNVVTSVGITNTTYSKYCIGRYI